MDKLKVIADFDWLDEDEVIGILGHDSLRGTDVYSFEFDKKWLLKHSDIFIGGDLQNFSGIQYNSERNKIFRKSSEITDFGFP